jgi:hypothetical protein
VGHGRGTEKITNVRKSLFKKLREREFLRLEASGMDPFGSKQGNN